MQKEIGSEFWDVPINKEQNTIFPKHAQWFISGRSALKSIIKDIMVYKPNTVAMPSWCCDSMVKPFVRAGINVRFYPVYWEKRLIQEPDYNQDVLFLMDYFGYTEPLPDITGYQGVVIRDITHSVFSTTYTDADYCFGSLRKWCGVWTGGYAWANDRHSLLIGDSDINSYTELRMQAMQLKGSYISGNGVTDKEYLSIFEKAEAALDDTNIDPAAKRDVFLARHLDVAFIRKRRRKNAVVLRESFPDWLVFPKLKDDDCPMFVPVLVPDGKRDDLHRYLIRNGIYCPVHWPINKHHKLDNRERYLYDNELSLVCDQRYTKEDMMRIVETIHSFLEEV